MIVVVSIVGTYLLWVLHRSIMEDGTALVHRAEVFIDEARHIAIPGEIHFEAQKHVFPEAVLHAYLAVVFKEVVHIAAYAPSPTCPV